MHAYIAKQNIQSGNFGSIAAAYIYICSLLGASPLKATIQTTIPFPFHHSEMEINQTFNPTRIIMLSWAIGIEQ